jgi:hypothetical protein
MINATADEIVAFAGQLAARRRRISGGFVC